MLGNSARYDTNNCEMTDTIIMSTETPATRSVVPTPYDLIRNQGFSWSDPDSQLTAPPYPPAPSASRRARDRPRAGILLVELPQTRSPVSYTHLTLPTKRIV